MSLTQVSLGLLDNEAIVALRETFSFVFDDNTARDAYFNANLSLLENELNRQTMAFVGTTNLEFQYWNGPHQPTSYNGSDWVALPVSSTSAQGDVHYWGDPNTELSMRARRDPSNGYLIFERLISGSWVEKFSVTDSVTTGSIKFIESLQMPTVRAGELGLYGAIVKDGEHGDIQILRPVFMDTNHNHYMAVAALPDGRLRVPQNVDAALNDPMNVPLQYKYVVLDDNGAVMRDALAALSGNDRLDASAIKNLPPDNDMTGAEIIQAIENDPTEPKLSANDIADLTGTEYVETDQAHTFDPINKTYTELAFEHTGAVTQTMPNLVNTRNAARLMVRNLKTDGSVVTLVPANVGQTIDGTGSYDIDPGVSVLFVAMTDRNSWHVETVFEHEHNQPLTAGIDIDDGVTDAAAIGDINLKGGKITGLPNTGGRKSGEIELTVGPSVHMASPNEQYGLGLVDEIIVEPPLSVFDDPDSTNPDAVRLEIEHDAFEPMHNPSFLAYLKETEEVIGKIQTGSTNNEKAHHDGTLWFDDIVWPAGMYIQTDRDAKSYGIQEADDLDPNVSGGTDYLIAFRVHARGVAPSDGFMRAYLYNASVDPFEPTGYLEDINGNPMVVQRNYKSGEELGTLDVMGVVNAKGLQSFTCHVVDTFNYDTIEVTDRTEGCTGLMIQALTSKAKSGMGLLQFENDTQQNIEFSSHYLGPDRMSLAFIKSNPETPVSYTGGTHFISTDGYRLINPNGIKVGVVTDHMIVEDNGVNIADFNFGRVFSAEETRLLRGKSVNVTVTLVDKDSAFRVALMAWEGIPDAYTPEIFTTRNNGTPVWQTNWSKADDFFISEDVVVGDHTVSHTFTVPADANNYALIIYPESAQSPLTLKLKEFSAGVTPAFTGYILDAPELTTEHHLTYSDKYAKFVADNAGYSEFRYTINNVPSGMPMPVGALNKGAADIELDQTVNQVVSSSDHRYEGALKFNADGNATVSTELLVWSEKASSVVAQTSFWWSTVSADGLTFTKIDDSELTVGIRGGTKAINKMPTFGIKVADGDRIALFATTDQTNGAYLQSVSATAPMISSTIDFNELAVTDALINESYERKLLVDRRVIPFTTTSSPTYEISLELPPSVEIGEHSAVTHSGTTTTSVNNSRFAYDSDTGVLTVLVGTNKTGKIYITLWG